MWRELAMFIKSHMNIRHLGLNIGGFAPEECWLHAGGASDYFLRIAKHPEIDELLVIPPLRRLSIRWVTPAFPPEVCQKHGAWCFAKLKPPPPPCALALDSLAMASYIKFIRCRLLATGEGLGLSRIRGGLVFNMRDQQYDSVYILMETDDSFNGRSSVATQEPSQSANNNNGSHTITPPRWPDEPACMEMVSDDFHASLSDSRALIAPARKEVTFHLLWIDGFSRHPDCALRALQCKDFWESEDIRKGLGLNVAAPAFATDVVPKGSEADPRNFNTYGEWRDRLRHLLHFQRWFLQFLTVWLIPRKAELSEVNAWPSSGRPDLVFPDRVIPYQDLLRAVEDGEAIQTILFLCRPAWVCVAAHGNTSFLWESDLHHGSNDFVDQTTGLLLEF